MPTPILPQVQETLDLLTTELSAVRFPGLEPETIQAALDHAVQATTAVTQAEEALERARSEMTEAQDALLQKAHRALAYARIYAEDDPALSARIEAIALPKTARRTAKSDRTDSAPDPSDGTKSEPRTPGRRGRPRKTPASEPAFDAATSDDALPTDQDAIQ